MKTLRHLFKRLVCWANYPTSRERLWNMFALGKQAGIREALKELPIVKVQPKQETEPLHLPPGMWSQLYYKKHPEHRTPLPSSPLRTYQLVPPVEFVGDGSDKHMTPAQIAITKVDTKENLLESTEEMPAVVALLHQRRHQEKNSNGHY